MHHRNTRLRVEGFLAIMAVALLTASAAIAEDVVRDDAAKPGTPATAVQATGLVTTPSAAETAPVQPAAPTVQYVAAGDPYGFTAWLNATRSQYGLPAVGYDPNLAGWAAVNNNHQSSRGMGHFVMGSARRQNCAMGSYSVIGAMWMASPAHRSALLDPTISFIGIAGAGAYWTFNAY